MAVIVIVECFVKQSIFILLLILKQYIIVLAIFRKRERTVPTVDDPWTDHGSPNFQRNLEKDDIEESCETLNNTMKLHDLPDDFCQQSIAPYESNNDQGSTDRLVRGSLGLDFSDFSWSDWFWSVEP